MGFFYILEREMVDSSLTLIVNVHILFRIEVASKAFTPCIMINKCASAERVKHIYPVIKYGLCLLELKFKTY